MQLERDFILRLIRQVALVVAHVLGLKGREETEEALKAVHGAYRELFNPIGEAVSRMDAATAADLLGDPVKILALGRLLHEEADLMNMKALPLEAAGLEARARSLRAEAFRREPDLARLEGVRDLLWETDDD